MLMEAHFFLSYEMSRQTRSRGGRLARASWAASASLFILSLSVLGAACQNSTPPGRGHAFEPAAAAAKRSCYAYLHGGDLWFRCGGQPTQVTHTARVLEFAAAGTFLALEDDNTAARLYALPAGRLTRTLPPARNAYWIWVSCGKIWVQDNGGGAATSLPTGEAPSTVPCMRAIPPGGRPHDFIIGSNGQHLAYTEYVASKPDYLKLCTERVGGTPDCADFRQLGGISVSDEGTALFDAAWGGTCYTTAVGAEIPLAAGPPPPAYHDSAYCTGIFTFPSAGEEGPLVKYSSQPQWLSPTEAAALAQLAASPAAAQLH